MTVHMLINCYWGTGISGGDKRSIEFLKRWQGKNREVHIYTTTGYKKLLDANGITEFPITLVDEPEEKGIVDAYYTRTKNCIKAMSSVKEGDILYSPTDIMPDVLPCFYWKRKWKEKVRWVLVNHHIFETFYKRPGSIVNNFLSNRQQHVCLFLAKRYADRVMTVSPVVWNLFKEQKWSEGKLFFAGNGIDTEEINQVPKAKQGYSAVFLARLNNSKGILELPEIWKRVLEELPEATLGIIGTGAKENIDALQKKIEETGTKERVTMLGYLSNEEAYATLKASKVFLFTSHEEGWGLAIAEAMTCGLPVVAYDLPVYGPVFEGMVVECPLLDVDAMAKQVVRLLEQEEKRMALGKNGQDVILKKCALNNVAETEWQQLTEDWRE